jgi:hydrogenase maturation protein HypF
VQTEISIQGIVQGVGFRPFVYRLARRHGLTGYVRNRGDAGVEIRVEGDEEAIAQFLRALRTERPPRSQIYDFSTKTVPGKAQYTQFRIAKSSEGAEHTGSIIPYDVAMCDACYREMRDPMNRRHNYFFITCTECGPRYTIIRDLPYDRTNTTMHAFPPCRTCRAEYDDPLNRRFHAQTVACKSCGPAAYLTDEDGHRRVSVDAAPEAGQLISKGCIVAVKGNGGFHLAASTLRRDPIRKLRRIKHRAQKPFAIMARSLKAVRSFAAVSPREESLLASPQRPILLLEKSEEYSLDAEIAPGLHNVGVMLPYTGLHYRLFDEVDDSAFVMTSANAPSEPIVTENEEAFVRLSGHVDVFLVHDRAIAQRCDDSVLRVNRGNPLFIPRSQGYTPSPVTLTIPATRPVLGVGAQENVNACVLGDAKAFISQYIGDVGNQEAYRYHEQATRHLLRLTGIEIEAVACDLHPGYSSVNLARVMGEERRCPVHRIQHHHAHALSLLGERGMTEIVAIVCDGAGYGLDGTMWGGEILHCDLDGAQRVAHLEGHPMAGNALATRYPLRMAASILRGEATLADWLQGLAERFPHGTPEVEVVLRQVDRRQGVATSSTGRVLDAVAAVLGLCHERTYTGEPAMKLEAVARRGTDVLQLTPQLKGDVIVTADMIRVVFEHRNRVPTVDLAFSAEEYLGKSLATMAIDQARRLGVQAIGFSGGVAYNEHLSTVVKTQVEDHALRFVTHRHVPPGDGGIAFGQAIAASRSGAG